MTFLNPAVLFGLVAVAIPLILHLLNLRRLRTVEFSTLAFLKQLQKSKMRRLKLRQILLLILRTLVIASLVLAFARPALRGTSVGGLGTHAKTTAVLLLDNSLSMAAADEHGMLLNQAKTASLQLLSLLKEGDDVFLQRFSEGGGTDSIEAPTHDISGVGDAMSETRISHSFHTLGGILGRSARALRQSKNFSKEIYLLTDLQRTNFAAQEERPASASAPQFDDQTRLFVVPIGHEAVANVAIDALKLKNTIFEKDRPFDVEATVHNYGTAPLRNSTISLYLDGKRVMQKTVDLPAEGATTVEFSGVPKRTGYVSGYVQTEPDAIDEDNQRYFTIFIPEKIDVLFVTSTPRDISFLKLALTADEKSRSLYAIETIAPSRVLMTALSRYDVIILSNVKSLSAEETERLRQFARDGGGIILFPGADVDLPQYSAEFCRRMNIAPLLRKVGSGSDRNSFLSFANIDFGHPIFSDMFEGTSSGKKSREPSVESPQITTTIEYRPGPSGQSIIRLSNGASFLTEYKVGNGRLLLYSVAATLAWSDFPVKGIFVPLIRRSVAYLTSSTVPSEEHLAGSTVRVTLPSRTFEGSQTNTAIHKSPDGDEEIIQPVAGVSTGERVFMIKRTDIPGIHEIRRENQLLSAFPMNVDSHESDTRRLTIEETEKWLTGHGLRGTSLRVLNPNQSPGAVVLESRFGVELWKYLLGFALACAVTEMIVARSTREEAQRGES